MFNQYLTNLTNNTSFKRQSILWTFYGHQSFSNVQNLVVNYHLVVIVTLNSGILEWI